MMTIYTTRTKSLLVGPADEPVFSERCTEILIEDEAAGEFVIVSQHGTPDMGKIAICTEEWPVLREAIDRMINECREAKP